MFKKNTITVILILFIIQTNMSVFAWFDTIIQKAWESLRPKESFTKLQKWFSFWDIYTNSHNIAKKEFVSATVQAIINMTQDLNNTYSCQLDTNDTSSILLAIGWISNDIQAMATAVNTSLDNNNASSFIWACTKLISCGSKWQVWNQKIINKQEAALTDEWFTRCRQYAKAAYERNIVTAQATVNIASKSIWSDIYYNGTLDDSPYDILVDIQRIWDVLFSQNEQTPNVLFFNFPNNSIAWLQAVWFDAAWWQNSFNGAIPLNAWAVAGTVSTTSPSSSQSSSPGNTQNTATPQRNNIQPQQSTTLAYPVTSPVYVNTSNTTVNAWIIDNYACLPTESNQFSWNIFLPEDINTPESGNNRAWSDTRPLSTEYTWPTFNINSPVVDTPIWASTDILNGINLEDPAQFELQAAAIQVCTTKCNWLPAIDKAMCIAKCTCGATYTKDGMFWLSICTIPSKQTDIVSSKSVQSIEEILAEINNVLLNLKNSWELIKHTKRTEMLDTSLSKIKLNKIFAFDINIAFKPILDSRPRKKTDAEVESETDRILKGTYWSIDIWEEKNKYVALGKWTSKWGNESITSLDDIQAITSTEANRIAWGFQTLNDSITNSLLKTQNAEVADIVKQFIEQNIRFWHYVHETLINTQRTADEIRQKIEKWS